MIELIVTHRDSRKTYHVLKAGETYRITGDEMAIGSHTVRKPTANVPDLYFSGKPTANQLRSADNQIQPTAFIGTSGISAEPVPAESDRKVRIVKTGSSTYVVEVDAHENDLSIQFTLDYAAPLTNPIVEHPPEGTSFFTNTKTAGKIMVLIAYSPNSGFPAGTTQLITIRFDKVT